MEFKKEFCLLQALAILIDSDLIEMYNMFQGILLDFSGILTTLKEVNIANWKILHLARIFFHELESSKHFVGASFHE